MKHAELIRIYGRELVIRLLGEERPAVAEPTVDVNKSFGVRLLRARCSKGHTQAQLASIVGCRRDDIAEYEADIKIVNSMARLEELSAYMGEPIEALEAEMNARVGRANVVRRFRNA